MPLSLLENEIALNSYQRHGLSTDKPTTTSSPTKHSTGKTRSGRARQPHSQKPPNLHNRYKPHVTATINQIHPQ
ncbi:hypothetical protein ASPFODRAFT_46412 [Aspergillus luchuensis CBS 106.47]|uniref:Uncharacterized protein n=1 Tax=Aspergillus luchuensis (strain CBS 106.47) TaxID=1137211 RepID=A0A1M3TJ94_ASPLC|nr:hypothetical protein ASPFODRAFT_46412 [Aspergillus luchuensis CBS 106.47]